MIDLKTGKLYKKEAIVLCIMFLTQKYLHFCSIFANLFEHRTKFFQFKAKSPQAYIQNAVLTIQILIARILIEN